VDRGTKTNEKIQKIGGETKPERRKRKKEGRKRRNTS
jgi:hypothetical protein